MQGASPPRGRTSPPTGPGQIHEYRVGQREVGHVPEPEHPQPHGNDKRAERDYMPELAGATLQDSLACRD